MSTVMLIRKRMAPREMRKNVQLLAEEWSGTVVSMGSGIQPGATAATMGISGGSINSVPAIKNAQLVVSESSVDWDIGALAGLGQGS